MKITNQARKHSFFIISILVVMVSCATIPYLKVNYRIPPKSDALKGKMVYLSFDDARKVKDILGKGARKEFENFSGNISLSLARGNEPGFQVGVYALPSLFREVFNRRLENLGIEVIPERKKDRIEVVIVLKNFLLDLIDRKWVVTMDYEAWLVKDKRVAAKQMITGQAERVKLVGRGQADTVMGEIITDMVNRLDVGRLFLQANL